jgi:hypothetical protein
MLKDFCLKLGIKIPCLNKSLSFPTNFSYRITMLPVIRFSLLYYYNYPFVNFIWIYENIEVKDLNLSYFFLII